MLVLGVGDAFSARWYSTCVALEAEGQWLLLDCPHPIHKIVREAAETAGLPLLAKDFAGLLLTHLHADHASGVEGLAFAYHFLHQRKLDIVCHPLVAEMLWENHLKAGMHQVLMSLDAPPVPVDPGDFFCVKLLKDAGAVEYGPFQIECRRTIHHVPTFAMRITAGGRTLGWSSDTAFDQGLIEWLSPADLIVHETNVGLHTPYEKLAALPAELRARMRLIHYPDDFDMAGSMISPLTQGVLIEV